MLFSLNVPGQSVIHLPLCAILSGLAQGIFLQNVRLCLGRLCHKDYLVEHTAIFASLWALNSVVSGLAGLCADALGWPLFFNFSGFIALFGFLTIYFMRKTSDNAL